MVKNEIDCAQLYAYLGSLKDYSNRTRIETWYI